ncbi:hypothetical protein [Clostridium sp. M14]|uniref:hypothetical protein n=1 Tax=Clostridium sp. M14 TaxID=2716311 RepID=UPI001CCF634A|nr:hypothetical protein [Clostridium sp. M14]MBZ9690745.1 hypothetical protein [Clostridium sp. M14]
MKLTSNYSLKKPDGSDVVNVQDLNDNSDKIDLELKKVDSSLKDIANDSYPIVEATGTNTYVGSTVRITKLSKGTRCTLFVSTNSTGNCILNLNNYGVKNIKDSFGNIVNNLKTNIPYNLCYNGTDFILQGKGGGGNATADKVLSGSTFTNDSGPQIGNMPNQGIKTASLNCGGSYIIPAGYHNGSGKVTANSLASQTQATATAAQILEGFSAYVNGNKVNGNASIQSLGGRRVASGTFTYDQTITLPFNPSVVVARVEDSYGKLGYSVEVYVRGFLSFHIGSNKKNISVFVQYFVNGNSFKPSFSRDSDYSNHRWIAFE